MRVITKFQAVDGSEWGTVEEATAREDMVLEVANAMKLLKDQPSELNWEGYVQQDKDQILKCKERLFAIANVEGVLKWWIDGQIKNHGKSKRSLIGDCHPSWFGRMLDGDHQPLGRAYHRLSCIDDQFREWNQPYFAANPGAGTDMRVG